MNKSSAKYNRIVKRAAAAAFSLVFVLGLCTSAFADNDKFSDDRRIRLDGCDYDYEDQMYVYTNESGFEVSSNVVNNMFTNGPVRFSTTRPGNCKLYKNGQLCDSDISYISEPGRYVLDYSSATQKFESIKFTILNDVTGEIDEYLLPDGFSVREVLFNDKRISSGKSRVDFTDEGKYQVLYYCKSTSVQYTLEVEIDHTAPELHISNLVNGVAEGPVEVSEIEEGAKLYIEKDGREIGLYSGRLLKDSGNYFVSVTDQAGNTTSESFRILFYLNVDSKAFIIMSALAIVIIAAVLIIKRKTIRIR